LINQISPFLESAGFRDVHQLHGGILKYLEECGDAHYQGQCFVFDKRVAVDAALHEGGLRQCYACQAILSVEEQEQATAAVFCSLENPEYCEACQ